LEGLVIKDDTTTAGVKKSIANNRLEWVDYARGLAILLVVYRHTMVGLRRSGLDVPDLLYSIQEFLLNVRMPVFFLLSGVFLGQSFKKYSAGVIFLKKVKTLLYPYLLWSVILISIQIFLNEYTNSNRTVKDYWYIVAQPRELDHMWYLLALFNTSSLMLLFSRWSLNHMAINVIAAIGLYFFHFYFTDYSLVSDLMYNYIFLVIGVYGFQYVNKWEKIPVSRLVFYFLLAIPIFIAGQLFWLNGIDERYQPLQKWYLLPFLLSILIGCMIYYLASRILFQYGKGKWLGWIGRYSLYIYILHILVISSVRIFFANVLKVDNVYILIFASLILGVIVPVFAYRVIVKYNGFYLFSLEKPRKAI